MSAVHKGNEGTGGFGDYLQGFRSGGVRGTLRDDERRGSLRRRRVRSRRRGASREGGARARAELAKIRAAETSGTVERAEVPYSGGRSRKTSSVVVFSGATAQKVRRRGRVRTRDATERDAARAHSSWTASPNTSWTRKDDPSSPRTMRCRPWTRGKRLRSGTRAFGDSPWGTRCPPNPSNDSASGRRRRRNARAGGNARDAQRNARRNGRRNARRNGRRNARRNGRRGRVARRSRRRRTRWSNRFRRGCAYGFYVGDESRLWRRRVRDGRTVVRQAGQDPARARGADGTGAQGTRGCTT